ncbi:MAG: hypothetical protein R2705_11680 [Ilumatobacteraceae bacterium]
MLGDLAYRAARRMTAMRLEDEHLVPSHGDFSRETLADRTACGSSTSTACNWPGAGISPTGARGRGRRNSRSVASPDWSIGDRFITEYSLVCPSVLRELDRSLGFHRAAALIRIARLDSAGLDPIWSRPS